MKKENDISHQARETAIRRIKKCLALSKSSNEHEAATALKQARTLMDKYNITLDEGRDACSVLDTSNGKRHRASFTRTETRLINLVAAFFGCSIFTAGGWPVYVGQEQSVQIAKYGSEVLLRQMRQGRKKAREAAEREIDGKIKAKFVRELNHAYDSAWTYAVYDTIKNFSNEISREEAASHKQSVQRHFNQEAVKAKTRRRRIDKNDALTQYAVNLGLNDGKKAQLVNAVGEQNKQGQQSLLM